MRNYTFGLILLLYCISCSTAAKESSDVLNEPLGSNTTKTIVDDSVTLQTKDKIEFDTSKPNVAYNVRLKSIALEKTKLVLDYKAGKIKMDSVERFFTKELVYSIFPYWYGTPWTFEGHTNVPNQGEVACGYFVSTTLKHLGMNVNRYKMAQQAALTGLKMIAPPEYIIRYSNDSFGVAAGKIKKNLKPGIYMIGFDYHVGFLYINTAGLHFIHSNYMDPVAVVHEDAMLSPAFNNTTKVYLAKISNPDFLMKWMNKEEFLVPR